MYDVTRGQLAATDSRRRAVGGRWCRKALMVLALGLSTASVLMVAAAAAQEAQAPPPTEIAEHQVQMMGIAFGPFELTVPGGTVVTWFNLDQEAHTVVDFDLTWESPLVKPGDSYSRLFDVPGVYMYLCDIHEQMEGVVIVTDPGAES